MLEFISNYTKGLQHLVGMAPPETTTAARPAGLFSQLTFAIICRDVSESVEAAKIAETIKLHEGEAIIHQPGDDPIGLDRVTHFLSSTFDFPEYDSACDAMIPVVRPAWIDASLAKDKLANPRAYSPDPRLFLSEVVVCCADLPEGDTDAIIGGVLAMGGLFANKITSQVTHLVALSMDSDQCVLVQHRKLNIKIVLPHWFDDCLKLGRRIDEQPYMLPHPEILRQSQHGPPKPGEAKAIRGAVYPDPSSSQQLPSSLRGELNIFRRKHVMLASDLGVGSHLRGIFETVITTGGGQLAKTVRKTDMLICKYREGDEYILASQLGKEVGNLGWLYWLITNNAWTSPMRRMLHYPVARAGIPEFRNYRISLSNYSGEARVYLENLINASGAECTKTLKQDNTHLITAHTQSEKCAAARDWNIHVVNHLWLEDSYAKWGVQSVSDIRYTHFPQRTNLGEVVGQTKLDKSALEKNFFGKTPGPQSNGIAKGGPMKPLDRNIVDARGEPVETSDASTTGGPAAKKGRPSRPETTERAEDKHRTPATSRFARIDKENATPGTGSSRKSKEAAAAKLHQMTPDIQLYEKERKRTGGVIYGGRRKNDPDRVVSRKRSVDETSDTDSAEDLEEPVSKRARSEEPRPTIWLLVTGYHGWVGKPKVEETQRVRSTHNLRSLANEISAPACKIEHTHHFRPFESNSPCCSKDLADRKIRHCYDICTYDDFHRLHRSMSCRKQPFKS